ncbi:MAG: phage neck terminator protein [Aeromonadaceae bacterium]
MSIENNLQSWMKHCVPNLGDNTFYMQLPFDGPRPKKDYMSFQVMSLVPEQHSFDSVRVASGSALISETMRFNATMTVSINAYSYQGYQWLNRLHASAEDWQSRELLRADGVDINLAGMVSARNLSGLGDEKSRPRHQGDFRFYITTDNTFEIHRLSEFIITGKWVKDDVLFRHEVMV